MGWFEHKHYWVLDDWHEVKRPDYKQAKSVLKFEKCYGCGGVRTIEYEPGAAPIIREGKRE